MCILTHGQNKYVEIHKVYIGHDTFFEIMLRKALFFRARLTNLFKLCAKDRKHTSVNIYIHNLTGNVLGLNKFNCRASQQIITLKIFSHNCAYSNKKHKGLS